MSEGVRDTERCEMNVGVVGGDGASDSGDKASETMRALFGSMPVRTGRGATLRRPDVA